MKIYALTVLLFPLFISAAERAPEKPKKDIFEAIARNETGLVRHVITNNNSLLYQRAANGDTPLLAAIRAGNEELTRYLISVIPNWQLMRGQFANSSLHVAIESGKEPIVRLVLSLAPDLINAKNQQGKTPLMIAVNKGNRPLAALLLQAGADRNAFDAEENNSLRIAVENGDLEMARLLLSVRANDEQDIKALEHAANLLLRALALSDHFKQKYEKNKNAQDNKASLEYLQEAQRYQRLLKEFFRHGANRGAEYKKRMKQILNAFGKVQDKALWDARETYAKSLDSVIQSLKH